jgi:hypothetical protein
MYPASSLVIILTELSGKLELSCSGKNPICTNEVLMTESWPCCSLTIIEQLEKKTARTAQSV